LDWFGEGMSNVEEVASKIEKMSLADHLKLASLAIDTNMEEQRLGCILLSLEIKLQKKRMCKALGIKE
jgi:hypothetical protein